MPYHSNNVWKLTHLLGMCVLTLAVLLVSSCIDIESTLTFEDAGSGTVEFRYRMYAELYRAASLENDPSQPMIPVLESDFRRLADLHEELELRSYSVKDAGEQVELRVRLRFGTIEALNAAFGGTQVVRVEETAGAVVLTQQFGNPSAAEGVRPAPYGTAGEVFGPLLEGYQFVTVIRTPATIRHAFPAGAQVGDREIRLEYPLARLLDLDHGIRVEARW